LDKADRDSTEFVMKIRRMRGYSFTATAERKFIRDVTDELCQADRDITEFVMKILRVRGYSLTANEERKLTRDVTDEFCHVALDFDTDMKAAS
jgi:hypothetical protein